MSPSSADNPSAAATRAKSLRILGLPATATRVQISAAHKKLAKQLHPDRPGGTAVAFRRIQEAYEFLQRPTVDTAVLKPGWDEEELPGPAHDDWVWEDHRLYEVCWANNTSECLTLLAAGARPDQYQNNVVGWTTLMLAAQHGNLKMVEALLAHGASPWARDFEGIDASKWAKRRKRWKVLDMLEAAKKRQPRGRL